MVGAAAGEFKHSTCQSCLPVSGWEPTVHKPHENSKNQSGLSMNNTISNAISNAIRPFNGKTPELGHNVFVDDSAIVLGDVFIGDDSSVWPFAVIRGDMHAIRIGKRTSIQDGAVLHITHSSDYNPGGYPLNIGNDVTVGHKAVLHGCTIHDRCLIGIGAIVLDGAVIEEEVIVGAGCLVPPGKRLESGYVYKGNPAQQTRSLTEKERKYFQYAANNYVNLKDKYLDG